MINQSIKDAYYAILRPASILAKPLYGLHWRLSRKGADKVHLGCGSNYLPGFVNIDGNFQRRVDYLLDVRAGLPFPDDSIGLIYSCHMLEHLLVADAVAVLEECRRVLRPSGRLRLTLPDFSQVFAILEGDQTSLYPRAFSSKEGQAINFLFCDGQHKFAYSFDVLEELAKRAGFRRVERADVGFVEGVGAIEEPQGSFAADLYK